MKALTTLKSAINQSSSFGIMALVMLVPVIYPHLAFAADQTLGQSAQIFQIKITDSSVLTLNTNQPSPKPTDPQQADPLTVNLQEYLKQHNSPLAGYTTQLLGHDNWKTIIAISFVESDMCILNLNHNCSGIGGPGHFYAFKDFNGWIDCMSNLLDSHYNGWTLDKMNGVYVQPKSPNWAYGSKKVFAELTTLEQKSNDQRAQLAQDAVYVSTQNAELATIAQ